MSEIFFKNAEISPEAAFAGDSEEIRIRLKMAKDFKGKGQRLVIDLPAYLGFSRPTFMDQEDNGFTQIRVSNPDLVYKVNTWDMEIADFPTREKQSFRGMAQRIIVIDFIDGEGAEDDLIEIIWGYVREGFGTGTKVASIVPFPDFKVPFDIRFFKDDARGLPDFGRSFKGYERPKADQQERLLMSIEPRKAASLRLIKSFRKSGLQILDRFSNIVSVDNCQEHLEESIKAYQNRMGVWELDESNPDVNTRWLPLKITPDFHKVMDDKHIFFGDLHCHSGVSNDCIEREKNEIMPEMMFSYGKESAFLDFMAITDHHQPWDIERNKIGKANWNLIQDAARRWNVDSEFVAISGLEYRCIRGDTAVIFENDMDYDFLDDSSLKDIRDLWKKLGDKGYLSIPHFHNQGGLEDGQWFHCPYGKQVEPYLEIYSCHGSYEQEFVLERTPPLSKYRRPDRNAVYLLNQGHKYALGCNSDGHKGNPGRNGLTAVFAKELSKTAIFQALRDQQLYGTTGARIKILFRCQDNFMGSTVKASNQLVFRFQVEGEDSLKKVELLKNGVVYHRFSTKDLQLEKELVVKEEDPRAFWYLRVVQADNHIAWSSPVWVE